MEEEKILQMLQDMINLGALTINQKTDFSSRLMAASAEEASILLVDLQATHERIMKTKNIYPAVHGGGSAGFSRHAT